MMAVAIGAPGGACGRRGRLGPAKGLGDVSLTVTRD